MMKTTTVITKWVYAIVRITLIWWMANSPYAILLITAFAAEDEGQVGAILLLGIFLLPFVFMPGTIATFGIGKEFYNQGNEFPLFITFFKYYKREYINGLKFGGAFVCIMALLYIAYSYYSSLLGLLFGLIFIFFMVVAIFYFIVLLSILVDRANSFTGYFTVTTQLITRHPLLTISMIFKMLLTVCFSGMTMPSLLVFACPGIIVLLVMHFYKECLKREEERNPLIISESNIL